MTCPTCELIASDTSHLEAVQQWECEKAELVNALESAIRALGFLPTVNMQHRDDSLKLRALAECRMEAIRVLPVIKAVIQKYEVPA